MLKPCPPQERQSIIRFWLQNLRAKQGEALHNVRFLEDQPISKWAGPASNHAWGAGWGLGCSLSGARGRGLETTAQRLVKNWVGPGDINQCGEGVWP